jgi:hypothetical protein
MCLSQLFLTQVASNMELAGCVAQSLTAWQKRTAILGGSSPAVNKLRLPIVATMFTHSTRRRQLRQEDKRQTQSAAVQELVNTDHQSMAGVAPSVLCVLQGFHQDPMTKVTSKIVKHLVSPIPTDLVSQSACKRKKHRRYSN